MAVTLPRLINVTIRALIEALDSASTPAAARAARRAAVLFLVRMKRMAMVVVAFSTGIVPGMLNDPAPAVAVRSCCRGRWGPPSR